MQQDQNQAGLESGPLPEPDYDYIKPIQAGGYGHVYLYRRRSGEYCAGKFIYRHLFDNEEPYIREFKGVQRFQALGGRSEFLLKLLHVRRRDEEGYFCYMMELADDLATGTEIEPERYVPRTLKNELLKRGRRERLPAAQCLDVAIQLARGLKVLHDNGLIHRDVKPSNIVFVNGVVKLADIGLVTGVDASLTKYTPRPYAAPESEHTARSDIFSFGKVLYELCSGQPVESFPSLPVELRGWPDRKTVLSLNKVIGKACARDLKARYRSADELLGALLKIRGAEATARCGWLKSQAAKLSNMLPARLGLSSSVLGVVGGEQQAPNPVLEHHDLAERMKQLERKYAILKRRITAATIAFLAIAVSTAVLHSRSSRADKNASKALEVLMGKDVWFAHWHQGEPPVRLIRSDEGICVLTGVRGHFAGAGESVGLWVEDGYWRLGGHSRQQGVAADCAVLRVRRNRQ